MRVYKIMCVLLASLLMLALATGCESYSGPYIFWRQDRSNVEKVEICSYDRQTGTRTVIAELPDEDVENILDDISSLQCLEWGPGDHPREYGILLVCITYSDGEIELIGYINIGYITPEGVHGLTPYFIYDGREFYDLICRYVDESLLPDMSEEFPQWYPQT